MGTRLDPCQMSAPLAPSPMVELPVCSFSTSTPLCRSGLIRFCSGPDDAKERDRRVLGGPESGMANLQLVDGSICEADSLAQGETDGSTIGMLRSALRTVQHRV